MPVSFAVRAPRYLSRFRCIGSACEDHCCGGWQSVDVDAETYRAYQQVGDSDLGPTLRRLVERNPEPAGPEEFGLIRVTAGGCCPLLSPERLCPIQAQLGETLLPTTCDTFPRQATLIDGVVEVAGRFACPEVVRLALLEPDALDVVDVEPDRRLRERGRYWVEAPWLDLPPGDPRQHYHQVRAGCLDLLGRAAHPLEARLEALAEGLARLDEWPALDSAAVAEAFERAVERLGGRERAAARLPGSGPNDLLLRRLRTWIAMSDLPPRYRACLERVRVGLELPVEPSRPTPPDTAARFQAALHGLLRPYLARRPYVLEHVLRNHVLLTSFPFHPARSFLEESVLLAARFALLRLHLVGVAAAEGGLTDDLVVETVQAFDKYPDSADYWDRTLALLRREGMLSLQGIRALLAD